MPIEKGGAMEVKRAVEIARLWRAGKLIGEDEQDVCVALLMEVERLREQNERLTAEGQRVLNQLRAFEEAQGVSGGIWFSTTPAAARR